MNNNVRNLGLDIVRSIAIILVIICHSGFFLKNVSVPLLIACGIVGVEIFFVLSGFLIGKIIIKDLLEYCTFNRLKTFYIRRWFRTLPLYYLVLFLVALINKTWIPKRNFLFLQNYNVNALAFLPTSWSLSVEEWFYLLIPIILIICFKICDKKYMFFIFSIGIALASFLLRCYIVLKFNPDWDYGVRKNVFLRIDAIMFGVILSGIKVYFDSLYIKITSTKIPMIVSCIGFLIIGFIYICYLGVGNTFNNSLFWRIVLFSLIPFISCFLILWLESSKIINEMFLRSKISNIFTFTSKYNNLWSIFNSLDCI